MSSRKVLVVSFLASFLAFNTNTSASYTTFNEAMDAVAHTLQHHHIDTRALILDHHKQKNAGEIQKLDIETAPEEQRSHVASLARCYISLHDLRDSALEAPTKLRNIINKYSPRLEQAFENTELKVSCIYSTINGYHDMDVWITHLEHSGLQQEPTQVRLSSYKLDADQESVPPSFMKTTDLSKRLAKLEALQTLSQEELGRLTSWKKCGSKPVGETFQNIEKLIRHAHEDLMQLEEDMKKPKQLFTDDLMSMTIAAFEQASICPKFGIIMRQGRIIFEENSYNSNMYTLHKLIAGLRAELELLEKHSQKPGLDVDIVRKQAKLANLEVQLREEEARLKYQNDFHKHYSKVRELEKLEGLLKSALGIRI